MVFDEWFCSAAASGEKTLAVDSCEVRWMNALPRELIDHFFEAGEFLVDIDRESGQFIRATKARLRSHGSTIV